MHNTHTNPGLDNPFRLMLPICHSAFHCKVNQYAQTYPSITLAAAYPKPKEVHYKIKLKRSNATKTTSRNLCPSPMATTYCHRSSQDHVRPGFLAPAFVIYFLTFKRQFCSLFFVYTKKSLQTTLSFFGIDLEDLSGIYFKKSLQTSNICVVF